MERVPAIKVLLLPKDTNALGTIFGGVILSHVDLASAVEARKTAARRWVTKAMREVEFHEPVFEAWMESVKDLGASRGTMRNTGGTGHQAFDGVGLPGFQFIQDPIGQGGPDRRAPPGSGYPEAWSASPRSRSSCCPRTRTPWARSSAA